MTVVNPESRDAHTNLEAVFHARSERRVLVCIPKSTRSSVAKSLASTIDDALYTGDGISWSKQLSIASAMHGLSSRDHDFSTSQACTVRRNLLTI